MPRRSLRAAFLQLAVGLTLGLAFAVQAQTTIALPAGYSSAGQWLAARPDGSSTLLLRSQPQEVARYEKTGKPTILEWLEFGRDGRELARRQLDPALAQLFTSPESAATALADGSRAFFLQVPGKHDARSVLAMLVRLSPSGELVQKTEIGHPSFASREQRGRHDMELVARFVAAGPDGTILVGGSYAEAFGTGPFIPWWIRVGADGKVQAESQTPAGGEYFIAGTLDGSSVPWLVSSRAGANGLGETVLHVPGAPDHPARDVLLRTSSFSTQAVFTARELAVVSFSDRWAAGDHAYVLDFFSRSGQRLRSSRWRAPSDQPGTGAPVELKPDAEGLIAVLQGLMDDTRLVRFDAKGNIVWSTSYGAYRTLVRTPSGPVVALERLPALGPRERLGLRFFP